MTRTRLSDLVPPRLTVLAVGVAGLVLVATHLHGDETVRYAGYLVVFCIWMAWFVEAGVAYLRRTRRPE